MIRQLGSLRVLAFGLLALGVVTAAEVSQAVAESFLAEEEQQMTALVNEHRAAVGLAQLAPNDALRTVARRQAQRMVVAGYIYHNPDLAREADEAIPGWLLVGENVGVGPSVELVEEAFLNSPKHRENIETPQFTILGVGAMASSEGSLYFTQNFAQWSPKAPAPPRPARTARPAPTVVRVPRPLAPAPPSPAPALTPAPTPAPPSPGVLATRSRPRAVTLLAGLVGMLRRFVALVAFWR